MCSRAGEHVQQATATTQSGSSKATFESKLGAYVEEAEVHRLKQESEVDMQELKLF